MSHIAHSANGFDRVTKTSEAAGDDLAASKFSLTTEYDIIILEPLTNVCKIRVITIEEQVRNKI